MKTTRVERPESLGMRFGALKSELTNDRQRRLHERGSDRPEIPGTTPYDTGPPGALRFRWTGRFFRSSPLCAEVGTGQRRRLPRANSA